MSTNSIQCVFVLGAAVVLLTGCGRKDSDTAPPQGEAPRSSASTSAAGSPGALDAVKAQASTVTATATAAVQVVKSEVNAASAKVQGLIDQATTLVGEQKWAEAVQLLSQLQQQDLTVEQQAAAKKLQEQAQQGAASNVKASAETEAASAVNKLLTPKR